jgi:hypothetical protein
LGLKSFFLFFFSWPFFPAGMLAMGRANLHGARVLSENALFLNLFCSFVFENIALLSLAPPRICMCVRVDSKLPAFNSMERCFLEKKKKKKKEKEKEKKRKKFFPPLLSLAS